MHSEINFDTTLFMPDGFEKKEIPVTMKLNNSLKQRLDEICQRQDRPMSYVARELMVRGLSLYEADGMLRNEDAAVLAHLREGSQMMPAAGLPVTRPGERSSKTQKKG